MIHRTPYPSAAPNMSSMTTAGALSFGFPEGYEATDLTYTCQDGSVLHTYAGKTEADFEAACAYYRARGFRTYSDVTKSKSRFTTLVGDGPLAHLYWLANTGELNIVLSATAAHTLPPATPAVTDGDYEVTVTQMQDEHHINGMGYVVRLADGSFLIFDGAYEGQELRIRAFLEEHYKGEGKPIVRAWVLTHSHADHYPAFRAFANCFADSVVLEHVIFAPIDAEVATAEMGDTYFNEEVHRDIAKFDGAKTVYAHTGMEFTFCNLKLEVLLASDDIYKSGVTHEAWFFNNSSLVTRLYDEKGGEENYRFLVMGDMGKPGADWMLGVYGDYLRSNMVQIAHHGVEDSPLYFYETVQASILYYPCGQYLYDQRERHYDVRVALRERSYTKEILIAGLGLYTRAWGTAFDPNAPVVVRDHPTL